MTIADGGEGTVEALRNALGGEYVSVAVADPLGRKVMARYAIVDGGATAVMEMAAACGLPLLAPDERNPMKTSTFGLGEMIADAIGRGCRNFYIGIGGSAAWVCLPPWAIVSTMPTACCSMVVARRFVRLLE